MWRGTQGDGAQGGGQLGLDEFSTVRASCVCQWCVALRCVALMHCSALQSTDGWQQPGSCTQTGNRNRGAACALRLAGPIGDHWRPPSLVSTDRSPCGKSRSMLTIHWYNKRPGTAHLTSVDMNADMNVGFFFKSTQAVGTWEELCLARWPTAGVILILELPPNFFTRGLSLAFTEVQSNRPCMGSPRLEFFSRCWGRCAWLALEGI